MSRGRRRLINRRSAVDHVAEEIGSDMFTTAEMWETGRRMIISGQSWPPYLKAAWRGIRDPSQLAQIIRSHPGYERADEGRQRYIDRTRTALWTRR